MKRTAKTTLNYRKACDPFAIDESCSFVEGCSSKYLTLEAILKDLQLRIEKAAMSNHGFTVIIREVFDNAFDNE